MHTHTHWEVCPRIITSQSSTRSCRQEISQVTLLEGGEVTDPDTVKIITEYESESEYEYEYDDDDDYYYYYDDDDDIHYDITVVKS